MFLESVSPLGKERSTTGFWQWGNHTFNIHVLTGLFETTLNIIVDGTTQ